MKLVSKILVVTLLLGGILGASLPVKAQTVPVYEESTTTYRGLYDQIISLMQAIKMLERQIEELKLQAELNKLDKQIKNVDDTEDSMIMPAIRNADVGEEFYLPHNDSVVVNFNPRVRLTNVGQLICATTGQVYYDSMESHDSSYGSAVAPCGWGFSIRVQEGGKEDRVVTVHEGYQTELNENLQMEYVRQGHDHESVPFFIVTKITPDYPELNKAPIIDSISGPVMVKVGEKNTWTVKAHDPENERLVYLLKWGDEVRNYELTGVNSVQSDSYNQSSTYSHIYYTPGTYIVKVQVSDQHGNSAEASITVNVVQRFDDLGYVKVLSPNGGEDYSHDEFIRIKWEDDGEPVKVQLVKEIYYGCIPEDCPSDPNVGDQPDPDYWTYDVSSYVDGQNWINWKSANGWSQTKVQNGYYKVKVCGLESNECDMSDSYFRISGRG